MASKKFIDGTIEKEMFMDLWNMMQEFWIPEHSDKYWEDMIRATDEFIVKYKELPISKDLALALVMYLDKKQEDV